MRLGAPNLFEVVEPAYQAHKFYISHGLLAGNRNATLAKSCKVSECARSEPLVWQKWVNVSGRAVEVEVK